MVLNKKSPKWEHIASLQAFGHFRDSRFIKAQIVRSNSLQFLVL